MKLKNLEFLFKSNVMEVEHNEVYITNLLNKFEVALQFDEEHLLLPSLLPTETELLEMARKKSDVKVWHFLLRLVFHPILTLLISLSSTHCGG